jgi:solute carrier family 36 (proton-coupled amino acid transporter)
MARQQITVLTRLLDFLFLYGHFAGEDLEESDEEEGEADEESGPMPIVAGSSQPAQAQSILRRGDTQRTIGPRTVIAATQPLSPDKLLRAGIDEETPLLVGDRSVSRMRKRSLSRSRRGSRSSHGPHHGDATVTQAVLMASTLVYYAFWIPDVRCTASESVHWNRHFILGEGVSAVEFVWDYISIEP